MYPYVFWHSRITDKCIHNYDRLTITAKDARCSNSCIANSTVLASGSAGSDTNFTSIQATVIAPVNSTTLYVQQHSPGTVWLDDFTVVEA